VPERRACRVLGQSRSTQRRVLVQRDDEEALTQAIVGLASEYGRYGYRRVTALLRTEGWYVNHKRVERIWRREELKVPTKQPKRDRLWLHGPPEHLRSDNGAEFTATAVREWLQRLEVKTLFIEPGSP
jgi:transposase InsO family protein